MNTLLQRGRMAVVLVLYALISACSATTTQNSAVSSYSGSLGTSVDAKRKAKIEAARKRAKANRIKRQKAFAAKRAARSSKAKRTEAKLKKQRAIKKARKQKVSKKKTLRMAKAKTAKRKKTVVKKGKVKKLKKSTNAFVGGRSRGIVRNAPWKCVPSRLKKVINQISKKYGKVIVNSTHRSSKRNRRVGGKRRSYHLRCQAVDFRVRGSTKGLTRWLARHPLVGGYKRYPAGHYHIDTGPKRTW